MVSLTAFPVLFLLNVPYWWYLWLPLLSSYSSVLVSSPSPFPYLPALVECDELQLEEYLSSPATNGLMSTEKNTSDTTAENPFTKPAKRPRQSLKNS